MNREIINYIKQCRESGMTGDAIKGELLKVGWSETEVDEALNSQSLSSAVLNSFQKLFSGKNEYINKKSLYAIVIIQISSIIALIVASLITNKGIYEMLVVVSPDFIERSLYISLITILSVGPLNDMGVGIVAMLIGHPIIIFVVTLLITLIIYLSYFFIKKRNYLAMIICITIGLSWIGVVVNEIRQEKIEAKKENAVAFYFDDKLLEQKIQQTESVEICKNAPDSRYYSEPDRDRNNCYIKFAEIKKDVEVCKMIGNIGVQDQCYLNLTKAMADISICEMIHTGKYETYEMNAYADYAKDFCYKNVAVLEKNISNCEKIKSIDVKNLCSAVVLNNKAYCSQISDSPFMYIKQAREECANNFK